MQLAVTLPAPPLELGPAAIAAISDAVHGLMPWLERAHFRVLASGGLELDDPDAAEAVRVLREAVEELIPLDLRDTLGERSGLGWNVFFGHVVAWWLPLRRQLGFLRALANRAEVHRVPLKLLWNQGRSVSPTLERLGSGALIQGGIAGGVAGLLITRVWPGDPLLALMALGLGVVLGRVAQRVLKRRVCGDVLCRSPIGAGRTCPFCGADTRH